MNSPKNVILLFSGGTIELEFAREFIKDLDYNQIIAIDKGLEAACLLELVPDYIVGDFDSVAQELIDKYSMGNVLKNKKPIVQKYSSVKDDTDTQIGIELALSLKPSQIVILGGIGTRMDHTLANIHLLRIPQEKKIDAYMIDSHNKIYLIDSSKEIWQSELYGSYYSLLPLTQKVMGLTLKGFRYPLEKATLEMGRSLGISNEIVAEQAAIELEQGILIAIEAKD